MLKQLLSALAAICVLIPGTLSAQTGLLHFDVTAYVQDDENKELNMQLSQQLAEVLLETGGVGDINAPNYFVIGGDEEGGYLALSLFVLQRLPEHLIKFSGEHEVFYKAYYNEALDELPAEGTEIRQFMSEEYMRQFGMLAGHYVEVTAKADLDETLRRMVEQALAGPQIRR